MRTPWHRTDGTGVTFAYDADGRLVSIVYEDGRSSAYQYNAAYHPDFPLLTQAISPEGITAVFEY